MSKPVPPEAWQPVTDLERMAVNCLARCTFLPGTWNKRFARDIAQQVAYTNKITVRQRDTLWKLCRMYRRQIHIGLVTAEAQRRHAARTNATPQLPIDIPTREPPPLAGGEPERASQEKLF